MRPVSSWKRTAGRGPVGGLKFVVELVVVVRLSCFLIDSIVAFSEFGPILEEPNTEPRMRRRCLRSLVRDWRVVGVELVGVWRWWEMSWSMSVA